MRKIAIAFIALLLVASSMQELVNPLGLNREVTFGGVKQSHDDLHPSNVKKFFLPQGTTELAACKPGHPDFFKFMGVVVGTVSESQPQFSAETPCFKSTTFAVKWTDKRTAKVTFTNGVKKAPFCSDHFLITTLISYDLHTNWMYFFNTITYKFKTDEEAQFARTAGIKIMLMCDSWRNLIPNIIITGSLLIPEILGKLKIPITPTLRKFFALEQQNFLERYIGAKFIPRKQQYPITEEYIRKYIQSGDILVLTGPSGTGSLIYYGTGGPVTHAAIAMWETNAKGEKNLWILEANGQGLVRIDLEQWWGMYNSEVAWLPLSKESRAKFDADKAWKWFHSVENLRYGTDNFMLTLIDDPLNNFSGVVDVYSFVIMLRSLDYLVSGLFDTLLGKALNQRLAVKGVVPKLSFTDILYEAQRRGTDIVQLLKIPEIDGWLYDGDQQYVCSALAIEMLQRGGLLQGLDINSHEFTPRDVYMIQLYNSDPKSLPDLCQKNDPGQGFCQLKGNFKIDTALYNSVKPYSHMNDRCPSLAPQFLRPSNC